MGRSTIELEISPEIENQARLIAEGENCSMEAILQEGLALLFGNGSFAEYLLDRLGDCTDEQLWALVYQRLTASQDRRMRELLERRSQDALLEQEVAESRVYVDLVNRHMLLRSRALVLLKERGHDIEIYLGAESAVA